jgi:hypothetical protein
MADVTSREVAGEDGKVKVFWNLKGWVDVVKPDHDVDPESMVQVSQAVAEYKQPEEKTDWDEIALGKILTHVVGSFMSKTGDMPTEQQFQGLVQLSKKIKGVQWDQ